MTDCWLLEPIERVALVMEERVEEWGNSDRVGVGVVRDGDKGGVWLLLGVLLFFFAIDWGWLA